jgi:hypothetical protein
MAILSDYAMKNVLRISCDDTDGKHKATIRNIKNGNFTNGVETVWATGMNEQRLAGFETNETATFTATSGSISEAGFMLNGATVETLTRRDR